MNPERVLKDRNFVNFVLSKLPRYITNLMSHDELMSELNLVVMLCSKSFDPKVGSFTNFVIRSLTNNLYNHYNRVLSTKNREISIGDMDFEYSEDNNLDNKTLLAFFNTLEDQLVGRLTDFALGKIKREDINNPPLKLSAEEVDRIIERIDSMV